MNFLPRYKAGVVDYWFAEAITQFVNGFISGIGGGTFVGGGTAIAASQTGATSGVDWFTHAGVAAGGIGLTAIGNGVKRVIVWHNDNPFPNPWPRPTGDTQAPFPVNSITTEPK